MFSWSYVYTLLIFMEGLLNVGAGEYSGTYTYMHYKAHAL